MSESSISLSLTISDGERICTFGSRPRGRSSRMSRAENVNTHFAAGPSRSAGAMINHRHR